MAINSGSEWLFAMSLVIYLVTTILYIFYAALKNDKFSKFGTWILIVGVVVHATALVLRTIEAKHAPFVNIYESLTFFSWLIAFIYLVFQFKFRIKILGVLITPLAFLAIAVASILPGDLKEIRPLVPALQSHWLEFHIATCFVGYACFAVSFALGIAYLVKRNKSDSSTVMTRDKLDMIGYKAISLGFPFLTLGIVSGSIWASAAWGRYWAWDPKEVWSLITWLIYAIYLHLRIVSKWKGTTTAIVSVIGFAAVIFTFLGVNFLLSGLHSYG